MKDYRHAFASNYGEIALNEWLEKRKWWNVASLFDKVSHEGDVCPRYDGHARFNAMGPVLQCPPSMMHSYGRGDEEKVSVRKCN